MGALGSAQDTASAKEGGGWRWDAGSDCTFTPLEACLPLWLPAEINTLKKKN